MYIKIGKCQSLNYEDNILPLIIVLGLRQRKRSESAESNPEKLFLIFRLGIECYLVLPGMGETHLLPQGCSQQIIASGHGVVRSESKSHSS